MGTDPFGILEPDEVYFRANQNIVEGLGGINSDTVTGPVLVRCGCAHPARSLT